MYLCQLVQNQNFHMRPDEANKKVIQRVWVFGVITLREEMSLLFTEENQETEGW